jgi:catechol 2,3-dioxygenase-like lactoylglutathione lyase family enzyme
VVTVKVQFIASFAAIAPNPEASKKLYVEALGLPLEPNEADGDYYSSEHVEGAKHFGVWPLRQAAQACFGTDEWPADLPVPQATMEFDVGSADGVAEAAAELERAGFTLVHPARQEPWGQWVARWLSPEGLLLGFSYAPWQH